MLQLKYFFLVAVCAIFIIAADAAVTNKFIILAQGKINIIHDQPDAPSAVNQIPITGHPPKKKCRLRELLKLAY